MGSVAGSGMAFRRPGLKLHRCTLAAVTLYRVPPLLFRDTAWAYTSYTI